MHSGEVLVLTLKDSNNLAIVEEDRQKWFQRPITAMSSHFADFVVADDKGSIAVGQDAESLKKSLVIKPCG